MPDKREIIASARLGMTEYLVVDEGALQFIVIERHNVDGVTRLPVPRALLKMYAGKVVSRAMDDFLQKLIDEARAEGRG